MPRRISVNASPQKKMEVLYQNCLRTFGDRFEENYRTAVAFHSNKRGKANDNALARIVVTGVHPFEIREDPKDANDHVNRVLTGDSDRQRGVNAFYGYEREGYMDLRPLAPTVWCYKTKQNIPRPNWDFRQACDPSICRILGLQDRVIPKGNITQALEYLVRAHDTARVPATDDPDSQAVHLARRACSEGLIIAEALNECMLAVSNIVAGLPQEDWFVTVLVRWKTIRAFMKDYVNGIQAAARIHKRVMHCHSAKRFKQLMMDRQVSLPLPTNFAERDPTSFVPGPDFAFMVAGPGKFKTKQKAKILSTQIELQAVGKLPEEKASSS